MNRRSRAIWLGVGVALAIACGGGGGGGPTGPNNPNNPGGPSGSVNVSMEGVGDGYGGTTYRFTPASASVTRGGTVTWSNPTGTLHNVTFQTAGAPANVADHSSGSNSRTFNTSGTFSYSCTNHGGMNGSVSVQ